MGKAPRGCRPIAFRSALLGAALALGLSSPGCLVGGNDVTTLPPDPVVPAGPGEAAPTYAADVKSILDRRCSACHYAGGPYVAIMDLEGYANARAARDRIKARAVDNLPSVMPFGGPPLPADEKRILADWVAAGAPE